MLGDSWGALMTYFRRFIPIIVIAAGFFIVTLPQRIYAQQPIDINKNPMIMMEKQVIKMDKQILKAAKESKDPVRIKFAKEKLRQDVLKMKADKAALKKARN